MTLQKIKKEIVWKGGRCKQATNNANEWINAFAEVWTVLPRTKKGLEKII